MSSRIQKGAPRDARTGGAGRAIQGVILACLLATAATAWAQAGPSLWDEERGNRYSNRKARHVGDIITVLVTESSAGSNRAALKTKKESKFGADGMYGIGALDFLPSFGAESQVKNEHDGSGQSVVQGQLSTKISVQVTEIRPNGHLVVEGSRLISINGDEDQITLHGVGRPEDVAADNTLLSLYLAEARISYQGKGPVHGAGRRSLFSRLLSWIF